MPYRIWVHGAESSISSCWFSKLELSGFMNICRCVKFCLGHPHGNLRTSVYNCWFKLYLSLPPLTPLPSPQLQNLELRILGPQKPHVSCYSVVSFLMYPPRSGPDQDSGLHLMDFIESLQEVVGYPGQCLYFQARSWDPECQHEWPYFAIWNSSGA